MISKYKRLYKIFGIISIFIIVIASALLFRFWRSSTNHISIVPLKNDLTRSYELPDFSLIYSAPHLPHVRAFSYDNKVNRFEEIEGYIFGIYGYINALQLESSFSFNVRDYEKQYGQINLQKEFGDTTILVFDGWRIEKPEETLKQYAIIMLSEDSVNIDTIYTEGNFFATDIVFYNDQYYLIGNKSHSMESGRSKFSNIIMYNIHNNDYTLILSVIGLINIRDITLFENYVVASYRLSPEKEYFFVYDLKLDEPSANFNLSEYKKGTNANRFQHIIFLNENILLFYQHSRNKIGVVKLNEQFEVVESLIVDTVEHEGIKNIIKHQNDIYVLTNMREKGALSKFNNDINELRVLIDFEIINNKEMIFLSTVIFDEESIK